MSWSSSYGGTCSAPSSSSSSSSGSSSKSSSSSSGSSSSSSSSSGSGYTDGWSNNTAYTSKGTNTGFSNNGSSATQNGYSGSGDSSYWNGVYSGDKRTNNPETQKGVYSTPTQLQYLSDAVNSKRATQQELDSAKSMIAGREAAQGQGLLSSMLTTAGASALGPVGWAAGKAAGWLGGKAIDSASEYSSNPNYQVSKDKTDDDSTLVGKVIGTVAPAGVNGFAEMAYNDKMGDYNSYVNNLKSNMVKNGYMEASKPVAQQAGGSSYQPGTTSTLLKAYPQITRTNTSDNISGVDPTDVDWSTFNFYSGSVV